ncbi:DUF6395 domain-containing protein [Candidatus Poseidoniales archaeon]|nr:DUF6395 domain-containing protein [Candidatus Poseidoniales archaeon]
MEVQVRVEKQNLVWDFQLDDSDGTYTDKILMADQKFTITLPRKFNAKEIHPDHLALISILVAHPFVGTCLNLPFKVSEGFAQVTSGFTAYKVKYASNDGASYKSPANAVPGLAFSGGADSTACLLLMPKSTVSVFMDRPIRKKTSMYNKTASMATIKHAKKQGFEMHSILCDVEYTRQPLGFPTDLVPSIPLIAIAQQRGIDAIAFGTVMESAYRIGHQQARDYANSHHFRLWGRLFAAAGLPLYLPVAGVSEVGTSKIVRESSFSHYTRSCIRGKWPNACENCWKCFRKNMVEEKFNKGMVSEEFLRSGLQIREAKLKLQKWPVSHENVLAWALQGNTGELNQILSQRFEGSERDLSYLESFYPPSIDLIPPQYQKHTLNELQKHLSEMDETFFKTVTEHKMGPWLESKDAINSKRRFDEFILKEFPATS